MRTAAAEVTPADAMRTGIAGLWLLRTKSVTDERGTVREFFRSSEFVALGVPLPNRWSQMNMTWSRHGVVRGLHGEVTTKLVGVASGTALGVFLDARKDSPTYGVVVTAPLEVGSTALVPPGVCNGFQVTSLEGCQYVYCFDEEWSPGMPGIAVRPTDPALGIDWPVPICEADPASISHKDATAPLLADL